MHKFRLFVALATMLAILGIRPEAAGAANTVETQFKTPPAVGVVTDLGAGGTCDNGGSPSGAYSLFYPSSLTGSSAVHPVIVWGNGTSQATNATCSYLPLLQGWAKWGFVVVAANTGQAGDGTAMLQGAQNMVQLNNTPSSVFYHKLDTNNIGTMGHSQGAIGAMNAALNGGSLIKSVLSISTPDKEDLDFYNVWLCNAPCIDVPYPSHSAMESLPPIFFARGTGLQNASPCNIDDWISDKTAQDYYPTGATRLWAAATVKVDPPANTNDCNYLTSYPHLNPFKGVGYMTAWLFYTLWPSSPLQPSARSAFGTAAPELPTNTGWTGVTLHSLP